MTRRLIPFIAALIAAIVIGIINPKVPGAGNEVSSNLQPAQEVGSRAGESR